MLTPDDVHHGRAQAVLTQRQQTLEAAWAPSRAVGSWCPQANPKVGRIGGSRLTDDDQDAILEMRETRTRRPTTYFEELSDGARAASLRAMLAERPDGEDLWVFAYGSLIWRPCFDSVERVQAVLTGYRRRFSVWTLVARGTPAAPGLALALEEGEGTCHGISYRLAPDEAPAALEALWAREMSTPIYRPRWLSVTIGDRAVSAIAFVVEKTDAQYAGPLPGAEQAAIIAAAHGKFGSCRDYLANTVAELAALGVDEPELTALLREVDAIAARP